MPILAGRRLIVGGAARALLVSAAVAAPSGGTIVAVGAVDSNRVFQRDQDAGNPAGFATLYNKGWGAVPVTLTPAAATTAVVWMRLHDATDAAATTAPNTGAVIQAPIAATGAIPLAAGGTTVGLTLPAGPKFFFLDLALSADMAGAVRVPVPLGVGSVTAIAGQSIAVTMICQGQGYSTWASAGVPDAGAGAVVYSPNTAAGGAPTAAQLSSWTKPDDNGVYASAFASEYLRLGCNTLGVVCAIVGYALGAQTILSFDPFVGSSPWQNLAVNLTRVGKFDTFLWCQGDADVTYNLPPAVYVSRLKRIVAAVTAMSGRPIKLLLMPMPNVCAANDYMARYERLRGAVEAYALADAGGTTIYDAGLSKGPTVDGAHPSNTGRVVMAREAYRAHAALLGVPGFARRGPRLTGAATRASGSAEILLAVAQDGGSALQGVFQARLAAPGQGGAPTAAQLAAQFTVYAAGDVAAPLALSGCTLVSATQIKLTLAAVPAAGTALDVRYRYTNSTATVAEWDTMICDNATDADGIAHGRQLRAFYRPIYVPAPSPAAPGITLATIGDQAAGASVVAAGATVRVAGGFTGAPPAAIELATDGGGFAAVAELVVGNGGSWSGTVAAPLSGTTHSLVARANGGASTSASAGFTIQSPAAALPASGAVAQFDAARPDLMWQDAARTLPAAADGQPVRFLADALGGASNGLLNAAGNDLLVPQLFRGVQGRLPGLQLSYNSNGPNTGRTLRSAAGAAAAAALQGDASFLLVCSSGVTPGNPQGVFSVGRGAYVASHGYTSLAGGLASRHATATRFPDSTSQAGITATSGLDGGNSPPLLQCILARFEAATGTLRIAVNAAAEVSAAAAAGAGTGWDTITLGTAMWPTTQGKCEAMFHELVLWPRLLTDAERDAAIGYAGAKWGA